MKTLVTTGYLFCCIGFGSLNPAFASESAKWPDHPIRFVVGVQPGGTNDAIARLFAKAIEDGTGQPAVVENRPGASGNIGAEHVFRSEPDGYTFYVPTSSIAIRPALYKDLPFSFINDFEAVALLAKVPNVLSVHPSVPANTLQELVAYSRQNPGVITYGSGSVGSSGHVSGETIKMALGADFRHVPYKGVAGALSDARGGHIKAIVDNLPSSLPIIRAGDLKPIAVTSAERSSLLPNVPTVAESGIPGFEMVAWFGLIAPPKTPAAIIDRVNAEVAKAFTTPEVKRNLHDGGATITAMTAEEFHDYIVSETEKWGAQVRKANITLN